MWRNSEKLYLGQLKNMDRCKRRMSDRFNITGMI